VTADPATLSAGGVLVWLSAPARVGTARLRRLLALLSTAELERSEAFVFTRDKELYVTAHGLARIALGQTSGANPQDIDIVPDGRGRPSSPQCPDLDLSLSHTDGLVAVAVARQARCGVDVEALTARTVLTACVLTEAELACLSAEPDHVPERFHRYWTLKEAISKVSGQGLAMAYGEVELSPWNARPRITAGHDHIEVPGPRDQGWRLDHRIVHGAAAQWSLAVACRASDRPLRAPELAWPVEGPFPGTSAGRTLGVWL
jgi:4'-phosphopantetheinyl transferase